MKTRILLLVVALSVTAASAQQQLVPISPEAPLSDPVITMAAGGRHNAQVATNGDLSLAVWADDRAGAWEVDVARLAADGTPVDPFSVPIVSGTDGRFGPVVWNGSAFVVFVAPHTFAFITPSLDITYKEVPLDGFKALAATPGADPRFLFVTPGQTAVVDGQGNIVSTVAADWPDGLFLLGGASESGFLVFNGLMAERLDRDGKLIARSDSGLPIQPFGGALAGGSDGFLFVQRLAVLGDVTAYVLDANGVFTGRTVPLAPRVNDSQGSFGTLQVAVVGESDRYLVTWSDMLAEVRLDGTANIRALDPLPDGPAYAVAIASAFGKRMVVSTVYPTDSLRSGLYARTLTPALAAGDAHLVTLGTTLQVSAQIAAGANGYAVTWTEGGEDKNLNLCVRRFSPSGAAQGQPQIVASVPVHVDYPAFNPAGALPPHVAGAKLASSGDAYVLGWQTPDGFVVRRMAAATGAWLDPQPVVLPSQSSAVLASNGHDAVAVTIEGHYLFATRIPMSGAMGAPVPAATIPLAQYSAMPAIASDGSGYLVAWTNGAQICGDLDCWAPQQIFGLRLRGDATLIDAAPRVLDNDSAAPLWDVAVHWQGDRYLVSWVHRFDDRWGKQLSPQVAALETSDAAGPIMPVHPDTALRAITLGRDFVLFFPSAGFWQSAIVSAGASTNDFRAATPVKFLPMSGLVTGSFALASRGSTLAVVYDHAGPAEIGRNQRLYLRLFAETAPPARRHAVR